MKYLDSKIKKYKWTINKIYRGIRLFFLNKSLKMWKLLFLHYIKRIIKRSTPEILTIGLTYRCQCKCVHCSSNVPNRSNNQELETSLVKSIIDQAKRLGIFRITFFGGEPLLRKDIIDLVKYAHDIGMITRINTNGWLLSSKLISELKEAGLNLCDVSIDDPDPSIHDRLRGLPGLYQKVIKGMKILKEHSILCQIVTYAAKKNVTDGLKKIINLGKEHGVFAISIVFPMATGCWYKTEEILLTEEEKERVRALGDSKFVHVELPSHDSICNVTKKKSLYISPEGDVTPCPFIPYSIGNIKNYSLEKIWNAFEKKFKLPSSGDCPMNESKIREKLEKISSSIVEK